MHAPQQEVTGGHDGPRGGGSRQSSSEFGLQPERHAPAGPLCRKRNPLITLDEFYPELPIVSKVPQSEW